MRAQICVSMCLDTCLFSNFNSWTIESEVRKFVGCNLHRWWYLALISRLIYQLEINFWALGLLECLRTLCRLTVHIFEKQIKYDLSGTYVSEVDERSLHLKCGRIIRRILTFVGGTGKCLPRFVTRLCLSFDSTLNAQFVCFLFEMMRYMSCWLKQKPWGFCCSWNSQKGFYLVKRGGGGAGGENRVIYSLLCFPYFTSRLDKSWSAVCAYGRFWERQHATLSISLRSFKSAFRSVSELLGSSLANLCRARFNA